MGKFTKDEFIGEFSRKSGLSIDTVNKLVVAMPCRCGTPECPEWTMVPRNETAIREHEMLYGLKGEEDG